MGATRALPTQQELINVWHRVAHEMNQLRGLAIIQDDQKRMRFEVPAEAPWLAGVFANAAVDSFVATARGLMHFLEPPPPKPRLHDVFASDYDNFPSAALSIEQDVRIRMNRHLLHFTTFDSDPLKVAAMWNFVVIAKPIDAAFRRLAKYLKQRGWKDRLEADARKLRQASEEVPPDTVNSGEWLVPWPEEGRWPD